MIKKLTKKQEAQLSVYRDKWLKIGLSCEPADHAKAEDAAARAYKQAGLKVPPFKWAKSPLDGCHVVAKHENLKGEAYKIRVKEAFSHSVYGQHDASWLGFYNYFLEVCDLKVCEKLKPLMDLAENCGWWIPYDELCVLQEKTVEVHLQDGRLHCETGAAVLYQDGFGVWALNGIYMPKELVETPADKINPKVILEIKNVEVRREVIRKVGVETIVKKLGAKVIDKVGDYELLDVDLGSDSGEKRYRPYLKMKNPSVAGVFHIEGISPECRTVKEAICYRNGLNDYEAPVALS